MKIPKSQHMQKRLLLFMSALALSAFSEVQNTEFHGAGWLQMGRVQNSIYSEGELNDYNGNWMQNAGAQISGKVIIDDHWDAGLSLGAIQVHLARGSKSVANIWYPFWVPYVGEARITYNTSLFSDDDKFSMDIGSFGYNYNPDTKNLGLYLLKGYVYPGALVSGFGNVFGIKFGYQNGMVSNDLIFNVETEDKPLYDISLADFLNFKLHPGFEIGVGANFYRLIPQNKDVTSPTKNCDPGVDLGPYATQGQVNACFVFDTTFAADSSVLAVDTITGSLAGTKMVMRFRIDPKKFLGLEEPFGEADLVIYGEGALLGLKDYPGAYPKKSERMPMMLGFNFPGFGFLNYSLEVEYYSSPNSASNLAAQNGSWVPSVDFNRNSMRDNWKWAFKASKVFFGNMELSALIANDHLRLGGFHNLATGVESVSTPKDWYWTTKMAYFF